MHRAAIEGPRATTAMLSRVHARRSGDARLARDAAETLALKSVAPELALRSGAAGYDAPVVTSPLSAADQARPPT